jgi:hypothetical protein
MNGGNRGTAATGTNGSPRVLPARLDTASGQIPGARSAEPAPAAGQADETRTPESFEGDAPQSYAPPLRRSASLADADADVPRAGRRAAGEPGDGPMRPGDVDLSQIAFWDEEAIAHFRSEWHEVKADFVDDPVAALTRAHDLVTDAVNELTEALLAERDELDPLRTTSSPDTESMRMAMRGYREFLDRILAL